MPPSFNPFISRGDGLHLLLLYNRVEELSRIYCDIAKDTLRDNGTMMILTFFENEDSVLSNLMKVGIDINYYIKTDSLFVIDSILQFFNSSSYDTLRFIQLLNKNALRHGSKGVTAVVDMNAFFLKENLEDLHKFEELICPKDNQLKFKNMLCAYERELFDRLNEDARKIIWDRHYGVLASDHEGRFVTL